MVVFCALGCSTRVSTLGQDLEDDGFSVGKTQYFVSPLAKEDWYDENVLDYSQGYFSFPPPAGYRLMRYSKKGEKGARANVVIKRRQGSDHCKFAGEKYSKKKDIDLVLIEASCYRWQSGEFKRRYYFIRNRNLVYTFRMTTAEEDFEEMAADFDHFVDYTVIQYMQYPDDLVGASVEKLAEEQLDPELFNIFNPQKE